MELPGLVAGASTDRCRRALTVQCRHADDHSEPDFKVPLRYCGVRQDRRRAQGRRLYEAVDVALA